MPVQTRSASEYTAVVKSAAAANDLASKPAGSVAAARAISSIAFVSGGSFSIGAIASVITQSEVAKATVTRSEVVPTPVIVVDDEVEPPAAGPLARIVLQGSGSYVVKHTSAGQVLWTSRLLGTPTIGNVVTDALGSVYVCGMVQGTLSISNSDGSLSPFSSLFTGAGRAFIIKYNAAGFVQWVAPIISGAVDEATIAVDSSQNVYIIATSAVGEVVFRSADNVTTISLGSTSLSSETILGKYNSSGIVQWATRIQGGSSIVNDKAVGIAVDGNGDLYVASRGDQNLSVFSAGNVLFNTYNLTSNSGSLVVKYNTNGVAQWAVQFSGSGPRFVEGIATDGSSNLYIVGWYSSSNTTIINADSSSFPTLQTSAGDSDFFIVKVNSSGIVEWVARIRGGSTDIGTNVCTDSLGNVYVVGYFVGTTTIFNANGSSLKSLTTKGGSSNSDAIVVKYDSLGTAQWAARLANAVDVTDQASGVAVDVDGNVYVTGIFTGSIGMYNANDGLFGTITGSSDGVTNAFVVKYDSIGTVLWGARVGGSAAVTGYSVAVDSLRNVYTVGNYALTAPTTIFSAQDVVTSLSNSGGNDAFIAKYSTNGSLQWAARVGGSTADEGYSVTIDGNGNVYAAVTYTGTATLFNGDSSSFGTLTGASSSNIAILKYNTTGTIQWVARISTTSGSEIGFGITVSSTGSIYVTGRIQGLGTVFSANGTTFGTIANSGTPDGFIIKYNASGIAQWISRIVSSQTDIAYSIVVDSNENVYVTGHGGTGVNTSVFNSDGPSFATAILNSGGTDAFVVKYNIDGFVQWVTRIGSTADDIGYGIATDSSGNVYVTGLGGGSAGGAAVTAFSSNGVAFSPTLTNSGGFGDMFLVKYNTDGIVQWVARLAAAGADLGNGIVADSSGNVYVTGQGSAGETVTAFSSNGLFGARYTSSGGTDGFLVKYDTDGFVRWMARTASSAADIGYSVSLDNNNNPIVVYTCAPAANNIILFNADGTQYTRAISVGGTGDNIAVRYDKATGNVTQALLFSTSGTDIVRSVSSSSSGIAITGSYAGTLQFFRPIQGLQSIDSVGSSDIFIAKYTHPGTLNWIALMGSIGGDLANRIFLDGNKNSYLVGTYSSSFTIRNADGSVSGRLENSGNTDGFLVKYNSSGTLQWASSISSTTVDSINDVVVDSSGNVYFVATISSGAILLDADSTISPSLANAGSTDFALVKYNSDGIFQSRMRVMSTTSTDTAIAIDIDSSNNIYVTGQSSGTPLVFYNSNGTTYRSVTSAGSSDVFVVKYDSTFAPQWITRVAGAGSDTVNTIAVVPSGGVIAVGSYASNADIFADTGPSFGTLTGTSDAFMVKYSSTGTVDWFVTFTGTSTQSSGGVRVASDGSIYYAGVFQATTTVTSSNASTASLVAGGYLMKFTSAGVLVWSVRNGFTNNPIISLDSSNNIYVTGTYMGTSVITDTAGNTLFTVIEDYGNNTSGLMISYDSNGTFRWAMKLSAINIGTTNLPAVQVDSTGSIYFTGNYRGAAIAAYSV